MKKKAGSPYRDELAAQDKLIYDLKHEIESLTEENKLLKGAMASQDAREKEAGKRCGVPLEEHGCDWPDAAAERVLWLRGETIRLNTQIMRLEGNVESAQTDLRNAVAAQQRLRLQEAQAYEELKKAFQSLINKVNRVTAYHRHGHPVSAEALTELSNRQLDAEERARRADELRFKEEV